jgi:putative membrane protein
MAEPLLSNKQEGFMERRVILVGLAAAVAAPALAQTNPSAQQPSPSGGMDQLGQTERDHAQQTLQIGMVALETSRIATEKARHVDLKRFAGFEVAEQETVSDVMHSMMEPAATSSTGAGSSASSSGKSGGMTMQMRPQDREMIDRLRRASGEAFDREYHQAQLQGHRDLLQVQDRYLKGNPQNRDYSNAVKLIRNHVGEHVQVLEHMRV